MPRYLKINIMCILFLALCFPASSELYQYVDENGIMRLTDTIYSVPVGQRAQLEQFDEFEDLSNEVRILPIPDKSVPQTKKQTKVKKDITPKTAIEISAETEKNIIHPDAEKTIVSESKEKTTEPVQPIYSEKPIEEPDTEVSQRELHKSNKITVHRIDKKATSQKPALIKKPEKSIKKKAKPLETPETDPESIIVNKDPSQTTIAKKPALIPESKTEFKKMTPDRDIADAEKATQLKHEKSAQKSAGPDAKKIDTIRETTPKIQKKVVQIPEKPAEIKSAQKTDSPTVVKKEIKPADINTDKKTTGPQKSYNEPNENIKQSSTQPELKKKTTQEIKPESKIAKKEPDEKIVAQKPKSMPESDTKKTELIPPPAQTGQIETTVAKSQMIESDNSKVTQKDESIVLAKLESTRKTLSNKKEALNIKFMALMKEKQEIEDSVDEDDEKSVLQYNENVIKLNLKIKQYKTEKKFLQAEIEKYNHAIKQSALN